MLKSYLYEKTQSSSEKTIWCPVAFTTVEARSVTNWSKMQKIGKSWNQLGKFLIWTWILPSSKDCSSSSQLRLRLRTASETSCWGSSANRTRRLATAAISRRPVDTSVVCSGDSTSMFGVTCKNQNEDNKPLLQR